MKQSTSSTSHICNLMDKQLQREKIDNTSLPPASHASLFSQSTTTIGASQFIPFTDPLQWPQQGLILIIPFLLLSFMRVLSSHSPSPMFLLAFRTRIGAMMKL